MTAKLKELREALEPCPFCGSAAEFERVGDRRRSTAVRCTDCGARMETGEEAGTANYPGRQWNTRAASVLSQMETPAALATLTQQSEGGEANTTGDDARTRPNIAQPLSGEGSAAAPAPQSGVPQFDAMVPAQEELAIKFCHEIAGPRRKKGMPPDPVRLLEMARELYEAEMRGAAPQSGGSPVGDERIYPCSDCGKLRSKAEGGTTFTVCDECWDKHFGSRATSPKPLDGVTEEKVEKAWNVWWYLDCRYGQTQREAWESFSARLHSASKEET